MVELPNVTLVCIDTVNYGKAAIALEKSIKQIKPHKALFLTDIDIKINGVEIVKIPKIKSKQEYSMFVIKELNKYFTTSHVLLIQHDGYVINGDSWEDEFLKYDYIGAPWLYEDGRNVGNGGFSLRSKVLQSVLRKDDFIDIVEPEDEIIGRLYRRYLEKQYFIKFPPEDIADKFSYELRTPIYDTFGFHGYFHKPFQKTVVIKRIGAFGDVIQMEPVLEYFYKKGYRVVLDTLPEIFGLFANHYFKVHHLSEIDRRLLDTAEIYDLDMSYESRPQQLHLKSYYEFCGVPEKEMVIRNPKLSVGFEISNQYKIFKKYAVIHIDKRPQPGRNIYGIDWGLISDILKSKGFLVIQLGKGDHDKIDGAIEMNTVNESLLSYVVGGADLFIGIDSGISHIASAHNIPSIIMFGSVNPEFIHPINNGNKIFIHNHDKKVCDKPFCWHTVIGCEGIQCYIDKENPPCSKFNNLQVLNAVEKLCN